MKQWCLVEGVQAFCSTRAGGVSLAPYDSLNLGDHVGDDPVHVAQNRERLRAQLSGAHAVFLKQVHGVQAIELDPQTPDGCIADAAWTTHPKLACTMMVADCLPILLCDDQAQVVAAAHAGWRGLAHGVLENTVQTLVKQAHCPTSRVHAWLGPCIGVTAFEVGLDVVQAFVSVHPDDGVFFHPHAHTQKKWADLAGLARARLTRMGVVSITGNDSSSEWCTVSQTSRFFSYRRDGVTGRMAAGIWRQG